MSDERRQDEPVPEPDAGDAAGEGVGDPVAGAGTEPSPEELVAEMARQLARIPVRDLALQTMATFADLAGIRMGLGPGGQEDRDMAQAKAAVECLRALLAVVEAEFGAAQARPFREPLAQLQLLFARTVEEAAAAAPAGAETPEPPPTRPGAASRLWTPPGSVR